MEIESNPCTKCGKERIKAKEKIVTLNATRTKITTYVCPDKECQKQVEKKIAEREERKLAFADRARARGRGRAVNKKTS